MAKVHSVTDILAALERIEGSMRPLRTARDELAAQLSKIVENGFDAALAKVNEDPEIPYRFSKKHINILNKGEDTRVVLTNLVDKATGKKLGPESLGNEPWGERLDAIFRETLGFPKHVVGERNSFSVTIDSYYFEEVEQ